MRYRSFVMDSARWDGFPFRPGDIVISTPPKCGTTWTQRLCSLLLGVEPTPERPLAVVSPWVDMLTRPIDEVLADLESQQHRRFLKTHTPLDGLPWRDDVTYLFVARDPRDVAVSWDHHVANMHLERLVAARGEAVGLDDLGELYPDGPPPPPPPDPRDRFWAWVEEAPDGVTGLPALLHHTDTFWARRASPNVHLLHYSDLKRDLPGSVRRLAAALDVVADDATVESTVAAASIERMRSEADAITPNTDRSIWKSNAGFFHSGTNGQWRSLLDEDDLARYEAHVAEMATPELLRWLHEGGVIGAPAA